MKIHGSKISFYWNRSIFLSQYCVPKCLMWIRPLGVTIDIPLCLCGLTLTGSYVMKPIPFNIFYDSQMYNFHSQTFSLVKGSGQKPAILKYCTHKYIHTLQKSPDFLEKHRFFVKTHIFLIFCSIWLCVFFKKTRVFLYIKISRVDGAGRAFMK